MKSRIDLLLQSGVDASVLPLVGVVEGAPVDL